MLPPVPSSTSIKLKKPQTPDDFYIIDKKESKAVTKLPPQNIEAEENTISLLAEPNEPRQQRRRSNRITNRPNYKDDSTTEDESEEENEEPPPPDNMSTVLWGDRPSEHKDIQLGLQVRKFFPKVDLHFEGIITGIDQDADVGPPHPFIYQVTYEDEQKEDYYADEIRPLIAAYKTYHNDEDAHHSVGAPAAAVIANIPELQENGTIQSFMAVHPVWGDLVPNQHFNEVSKEPKGVCAAIATKKELARDIPTPKNYSLAMRSCERQRWREAVRKEFQVMIDFDVFEVVDRASLPKGSPRPISTTWVFKVKANADGTIERFKSRLCARGFLQRWGKDFWQTFSPVARTSTIRLQIAIATREDMELKHLDFKSAFLQGTLKEDLYMELPEGWHQHLVGMMKKKGVLLNASKIIKLKKGIYGLKQASRIWYQSMSKLFIALGFKQSASDTCLFLFTHGKARIIITTWVDDCIVAYNNEGIWKGLLKRITAKFKLGYGENFEWCLGMAVERDRHARTLRMHQSLYVRNLIAEYRMEDAKPISTPADCNTVLTKDMAPTTADEILAMKNIPYRSLLGALLHLANFSRPDISLAVGICSRFANCYGPAHWKALKRILRYLKGTQNADGLSPGLAFGWQRVHRHGSIVGYADADYAGDVDLRRSTSGVIFLAWGTPISWMSQRQPIVA